MAIDVKKMMSWTTCTPGRTFIATADENAVDR